MLLTMHRSHFSGFSHFSWSWGSVPESIYQPSFRNFNILSWIFIHWHSRTMNKNMIFQPFLSTNNNIFLAFSDPKSKLQNFSSWWSNISFQNWTEHIISWLQDAGEKTACMNITIPHFAFQQILSLPDTNTYLDHFKAMQEIQNMQLCIHNTTFNKIPWIKILKTKLNFEI